MRLSAKVAKVISVSEISASEMRRHCTNRVTFDDLDMPSLDSLRHDPNYEITVKNLETGKVRVIRGDGRW